VIFQKAAWATLFLVLVWQPGGRVSPHELSSSLYVHPGNYFLSCSGVVSFKRPSNDEHNPIILGQYTLLYHVCQTWYRIHCPCLLICTRSWLLAELISISIMFAIRVVLPLGFQLPCKVSIYSSSFANLKCDNRRRMSSGCLLSTLTLQASPVSPALIFRTPRRRV